MICRWRQNVEAQSHTIRIPLEMRQFCQETTYLPPLIQLHQHLLEELLARAGGSSSDEEMSALLHEVIGGHHAGGHHATLGSQEASGVRESDQVSHMAMRSRALPRA